MEIPELEILVVGDFEGCCGISGGLLYLVADDGFVGLPMKGIIWWDFCPLGIWWKSQNWEF